MRIWFIANHPDLKNAMDREWYTTYQEAEEDWYLFRTINGFQNLKIFSAVVTVDLELVKR